MTTSFMKKNLRSRALPAAVAASLLCLGLATQAEEIPALKNAAIWGSLASYTFAYLNRDNFEQCNDAKRVSIQNGNDEELKSITLGYSLTDCEIKAAQRPAGFNFRISPSVLASGWQASSGAGSSSVDEITFVPRAQYVWPAGAVRLDAQFGVGMSFISATNVGERVKSTNFQFSDEVSVGVSDATDRVRLAANYRHISNLGISLPNNGVDFKGVSLTVRLP
jgi:hypothetical protein